MRMRALKRFIYVETYSPISMGRAYINTNMDRSIVLCNYMCVLYMPSISERWRGENDFGHLIWIFNLYDATFTTIFQISKREETDGFINRREYLLEDFFFIFENCAGKQSKPRT